MSAEFEKRFLALRSRGGGRKKNLPLPSSPGPTTFCPTNAMLLPTPLWRKREELMERKVGQREGGRDGERGRN